VIVRLLTQGSSSFHSWRLRRLMGISQRIRYLRKNDGEFRPLSMDTASQRYLGSSCFKSLGLRARSRGGG
jgi:hypothetical protein